MVHARPRFIDATRRHPDLIIPGINIAHQRNRWTFGGPMCILLISCDVHFQKALLEIGNENILEAHLHDIAENLNPVAKCHVPDPQRHPVSGIIQLDLFPRVIKNANGLVIGNGNAPILRVGSNGICFDIENLSALGGLEGLPYALHF